MHQALALGRAPQSTWHLILPSRASAQGRARSDMLRHTHTHTPPIAHPCSSRCSRSAACLHGDEAYHVPWIQLRRGVTGGWTTRGSRVFYNLGEHTDSNTAGDMSGCSGTHTLTLSPKDPAEGPTQGQPCPLTPALSRSLTPKRRRRSLLPPDSGPKSGQMPEHPRLRAEQDGRGRVTLPSLRRGDAGSLAPASLPAVGKSINRGFISLSHRPRCRRCRGIWLWQPPLIWAAGGTRGSLLSPRLAPGLEQKRCPPSSAPLRRRLRRRS